MSLSSSSMLWLAAGFAGGVAVSLGGVAAAMTSHDALSVTAGTPVQKYSVSIDEVRHNLVSADEFSGSYSRKLTLSDGSTHLLSLRAVRRDGTPLIELTDRTGGRVERSWMGPFATMRMGNLLVSLKDVNQLQQEMHQAVRARQLEQASTSRAE